MGIENLKSYEPGQSGNPKGRPKGAKSRSTLLRKWLDTKLKAKHPVTGKEVNVTMEDEVALSIIDQARKGNVKAQALVLDSLYGKLTDKQELTGKDGADLFATFEIKTRKIEE